MNKIELNGKQYSFKWSFLAMREYEKITGKSINELGGREPGADDVVNMVYCGIVAGAKIERKELDLSVEDMAVLIEIEVESKGFSEFSDRVIELISGDINRLSGNLNGAPKAPKKKAKSGTK